jgi:type IV secretion system protein VirB1
MLPFIECAPIVHPVTMAAIVMHESAGNPFAIHNNTSGRSYRPTSIANAVGLADEMIARGDSVDLGLAQINNKNLARLGLTTQSVFDPCKNLAGSQIILLDGWQKSGGDLRKTLSAYNTGKLDGATGERYADAVYQQAGVVIPAIPGTQQPHRTSTKALPPIKVRVNWMPAASPFTPHW